MRRFLLFILLTGCGPSLDKVARTTQVFGVQQRCSQGPFEIHVPAFGSRWGEDVLVEARGNGVVGHSSLSAGSHVIEENFSNGTATTTACTLSDADRAAAVTGGPAITMPTNRSSDASTPASTSQSAPPVALVQAALPYTYLSNTEIAHYHQEVDEWSKSTDVLKRGDDVKIVFWSERPYDLQGTVFVVTHSEMLAPKGDDKKWEAHLDEVKADAEKEKVAAAAEQKKKDEEEAAKAREAQRCLAIQGADKKCKDEGIKTGSEQALYAALQVKCEDLARKNAADQTCRDDGWRNDNERPDSHPYPPTTTQSTETNQSVDAKPQGHAADRPPPAPQAETQPPKPSDHAEWISGSWQWSGFDWVWLAGGWRVPDQDRAQKLTATAPSPPPASRVDTRPPQPIASAVWADGYWHFSGGQWIWVPGHWAVPPRAGATWRPSTWIRDGVQLRLDPGGWR